MEFHTRQQQEENDKKEEFRSNLTYYLNELNEAEIKAIDCEDFKNQFSEDSMELLSFEEYCCFLGDDELKKLKEFWAVEKLNYFDVLSKSKALNNTENIQIFNCVTEHIQNKLDFLNSLSAKSTIVKMGQTEKLIILHEFGIIRYLKQLWTEKKINCKIEVLISTLIDEPEGSIRPRLAAIEDRKLNTGPLITKSSEYLLKFGLEKGEILKPKQK